MMIAPAQSRMDFNLIKSRINMTDPLLKLEMTIEEVLEAWPETAVIFQDYAAACIGCDLASFCTLNEAANEYQITPHTFLQDLQRCIQENDQGKDSQ